MDRMDQLRALVISELALANRDHDRIVTVIDTLAELMGAALVVGYRDDKSALDRAASALEGVIHRHAVLRMEMIRALGVGDKPPDRG